MVIEGSQWNAMNGLSIGITVIAIGLVIFESFKKSEKNLRLAIRACLWLAAMSQLSAILIWEVDSPLRSHFDNIYKYTL